MTRGRNRWLAIVTVGLLALAACGGEEAEPTPVPTRASPAMSTLPRSTDLAGVSRWLYMIDAELGPDRVDRIAASRYDLVVLDYVPSEAGSGGFDMAGVIAELHDAPHAKLVIAYIDIGQAESYRTYWRPGWRIGDPDWIAGADPDGWEGAFPVAYWRDEWRDSWLGDGGYLERIVDDGFDGVYLDWIEAYADDSVEALAEEDGVDPETAMVSWVGDVAAFGRARRPGFIVIGQNAADLVERGDYRAAIDAIAQEHVWFDGGAGNDPLGDCPLPRTDDDVDSPAYRDSLDGGCRRTFDRYPDGTLHVSSEELLDALRTAQEMGVVVFTVDYALAPENVASVHRTSRALGFVPFASARGLDRYVEPFTDRQASNGG